MGYKFITSEHTPLANGCVYDWFCAAIISKCYIQVKERKGIKKDAYAGLDANTRC